LYAVEIAPGLFELNVNHIANVKEEEEIIGIIIFFEEAAEYLYLLVCLAVLFQIADQIPAGLFHERLQPVFL